MTADTRKIRLIMELRNGGVTDRAVLSAIETVPREIFVPPVFRDRAYENSALPIGGGQTISQPLIVGLMTQALELTKRMKVLEVGTGSGYQTAILAKVSRRVYTIERIRELLVGAEEKLAQLSLRNVTTKAGDGSKGWPEQAPFDRIIVTAAAASLPETLVDQLKVGGIMVLPIGADKHDQVLLQLRKTETGTETRPLAPVRFVPLIPGRTA